MSNYNNRNTVNRDRNIDDYHNRPLASGFASLRGKIETRVAPKMSYGKQTAQKPKAVNSLKADGVDHINVHHHGETTLGRALSVYGDYEFTHNVYGKFRTIHGLMSYLGHSTQPDEFRTLDGFGVQKARRKFGSNTFVQEYKWIAMDATWQKVKAYPGMAKELYESTQPFDYYFMQTVNYDTKETIRVRMSDTYEWMELGLTELRNALREGREPDLVFLMTPEGQQKQKQKQERQTLEAKEKQNKIDDAERFDRTLKHAGFNPSEVTAHPLRKAGDVVYVRDSSVRHNRKLFVNYKSASALIKSFKETSQVDWVNYFTKVLSAPYNHMARCGVVIDYGTVIRATDTFEVHSIYEIAHGDHRSNVDVQFIAVPKSGSILVAKLSSECEGTDTVNTYTIPSIIDGNISVVEAESVQCGAPAIEYSVDHIPEALREYDFVAPTGDAEDGYHGQYRVCFTDKDRTIAGITIHEDVLNIETQYESNVRHNRKQITDVETIGYVIDTTKLVNGLYDAYEFKKVAISRDGVDSVQELLWYYGDDSVRQLKPRRPVDAPAPTDDANGEVLTTAPEDLHAADSEDVSQAL